MSFIYATDNFKTKTWAITAEHLRPNWADLRFVFTEEAPVIEFDGLSFGYSLNQDGVEVQVNSFPPEGTVYIRSDQEYLVSERLELIPETNYELYLWCENGGEFFEETFTFSTPRPLQPFDSWTWDDQDKVWKAPTPMPEDGDVYVWDEENLEWYTLN